ncbi:DUF4169 family protein [Sagittula sp. S175]|uniref:DUF4169 family protein n=1 Tax=Sagittula sp. S175 TaxID=3415129 RepID=UPI003C7C3C83
MSKVVNLSNFRKQKARADKRAAGDANAAQHGLSKAQKALAKARLEKAEKQLDGHKTDSDET